MKKFYFLLLNIFIFNALFAQCPIINSAMINSCGASEGINEFVVFTTTASATAGSYTLHYSTTNPPFSGTVKLSGANATAKISTGNITSSSSCTINEVTSPSTVIPANSIVIFIPSDFETQYDVSALCAGGNIYVVYINRVGIWTTNGNFGNNPGSTNRYLQISNGTNECSANIRTYTGGWPTDTDGNAVSWNNSGVATYVNNGCTVIPPPPGVVITPTTPISVCDEASSATFNYTTSGGPDKYSIDWNAAANAAGFVDITNATLTASSFTVPFPAGAILGNTYTGSLTATNTTSGLVSTPQNISITVIGKPVVPNIIGPSSLCEGFTYYSLQNAILGGVWNSTTPTIATIDNEGAVTGVSVGTAILTYTATNVCGSTISAPFNMDIVATPTVAAISGSANICTGSSVAFTNATPGGIWSSSNTAIATVSNTGIVTGVSQGGPVTITYTVTNACGSAFKTFQVTVGQASTVADIVGANNVCFGTTTNLTNAITGGTWSSSNTSIATISNSGVVTAIAQGTVVITYAISSGCGNASKTFTITVNDKPTLTTNIIGTANICKNTSTTLTNATAGGTWSSSNPSIATVSSAGVVNGIIQGTSIISYTLSNTCGSVTKTFLITVELAASVADITGNTSVCVGSTTPLTSTTTGGIWTSSNPSIASISNTGVVTAITVGGVVITYSISSSCGNAFKTFPINVNDKPAQPAVITGVANICQGTNTTLNNTTIGGTWTSSNTSIATVSNTGVVTGFAQGTAAISYNVSSTCGSVTSAPFTITVTSPPVVADISGNPNICIGSNATFTNAAPGGTWSSNNTSIATVSATGVVTGVAIGGPVVITYTIANSCGTTSKTFQVSVGSLTVAEIIGANSLCAGAITTLTNATLGGVWSSNNTSVAIINNTGLVTGVSQGTTVINYTVTSACGFLSKSFTITINDKPAIPSNIIGTANICLGTTTTLSTITTGGVLSSSNTAVATVSNAGVVTSVAIGQANILYTVTNGCGSSSSNPFVVTVNDIPVIPNIAGASSVNVASSITLTNTVSGGVWSSTHPSIATVNANGVVTGIAVGKDTIIYTVTNSCGTATKEFPITVSLPVKDDVYIPNAFTPNNDGLNDLFQVYGNSVAGVEMKVFNQWGELLFSANDMFSKWNGFYKGKPLPVGVYVYVAKVKLLDGNTVTKKGSVNLIR